MTGLFRAAAVRTLSSQRAYTDSRLIQQSPIQTERTNDVRRFLCSKFETWWSSMSCITSGGTPKFVVDGQAPMRQCLHPEACNKDIELPEHYNYFYDLRKDFVACYSSHGELSTLGVQEMLQCILLRTNCRRLLSED